VGKDYNQIMTRCYDAHSSESTTPPFIRPSL
jgi:hypothetical protein